VEPVCQQYDMWRIHRKCICERVSQTNPQTLTYEKTMYTSRILMQMSKHNMFASLERNLLSNTNMLNLNVSILYCTPHTAKPYVKMYPQTHKKHLHAKRQCEHHEFTCKCQNRICLSHIDAIWITTRTCQISMYQFLIALHTLKNHL